jgi:predicted porin
MPGCVAPPRLAALIAIFGIAMKQRIAFALMGATCAVASAQSSVSVFGIVDLAARHVKNGDQSTNTLASNGLNASRIGFKGYEDLGDGFKAGFWLEAGVSPNGGTQTDPGRFWNRRSTVSLIDPRWGEVRLGRDYVPSYNAYDDFDVFGPSGIASGDKFQNKLGTSIDALMRADNLVAYYTPPALGGFFATLAVAASNGESGKKYSGGRIGYAAPSLRLQAAAGQTRVTPDASGDDKYKFYVLGGSYDLHVAELMAYWTRSKFGDQKLDVFNVGASIPLGRGKVRVGYARGDASGRTAAGIDTSGDDAHQLAIGYVYDLSKRTALYGTAARVSNKGRAGYVIGSPPIAQLGQDSTGFEAGIRHSF